MIPDYKHSCSKLTVTIGHTSFSKLCKTLNNTTCLWCSQPWYIAKPNIGCLRCGFTLAFNASPSLDPWGRMGWDGRDGGFWITKGEEPRHDNLHYLHYKGLVLESTLHGYLQCRTSSYIHRFQAPAASFNLQSMLNTMALHSSRK